MSEIDWDGKVEIQTDNSKALAKIADLEQQIAEKTAEAEKYLAAWERLDAQQPPAQGELTAEREAVLVGLLRHWLHGESDGYIDIEAAEEWELELWKKRADIQPTTGEGE